ncbi:MAG: hypothetical protein KBH93_05555 [Anaerolineae bacterium]|nr:hypothetical protein [Anaerolineae bacterium]
MGVILLALFAATLFVLYIAIRRAWGQTLTVGGLGAILSLLWVVLYALLVEETSLGQAIFGGVVVGLGFAAVVVLIAVFFRANQPSPDITLISQSHQEEQARDRRDVDSQETE